MRVDRLTLKGFRNIADMTLDPCDGVNIIHGDNAQGKTNLIEALWLFTGARSFRGAKDSELIAFGGEILSLSTEFYSQGRSQTASIIIGETKKARLNDIELGGVTELAGAYNAVVFSPAHLSLVQGAPALRRKFLDTLICQLRPAQIKLIQGYSRVIAQRNSLLRDIPRHSELLDTLEVWDERAAKYAAAILKGRLSLIKDLVTEAAKAYEGISHGSEALSIEYIKTIDADAEGLSEYELSEKIHGELLGARAVDISSGTTSKGPHRDDIEIKVGGNNARLYGSQGQQRSCVLALKIAERAIMRRVTGENPIVLLDDVLSELDENRREYLLGNMGTGQVFITCCDVNDMSGALSGKRFKISKGSLV